MFKPPPLDTEQRPDASAWIIDSSRPISLHEVMDWDVERQRLLFRVLLPLDKLVRFGIDPISLADSEGNRVARMGYDQAGHGLRLELYHHAGAADPMMELELADTPFNQIEVVWLAIQDPTTPRFDIDVMPDGATTLRGTARRNLEAEAKALAHGLAPGQTYRGFDEFDRAVDRMEIFMLCLNQREYIAQPLYYHTAVLFERAGFSYLMGQARMESITARFGPEGDLCARLDGSSPFRQPDLANTVRGRAWAIHDGILDETWDRVRMVKRLGVSARVDTCPGVPW